MPKRPLVTINTEHTSPDAIPQLLRYLPRAQAFARKHGIRIVLHAPCGAAHAQKGDGASHIYFYAYPVREPAWLKPGGSHVASIKTIKSAYGFLLPISGEHIMGVPTQGEVSLCWNEQNMSIGKGIRSPEDQLVARASRKHLWILFNIAGRPWEGDQVVFGRILGDAAPWFVPEERLSRFPRRLRRVARVLHGGLDRGRFSEDFNRVAKNAARMTLDAFSRKQEEALEAHEKFGAELVRTALEAEMAAQALEKLGSTSAALEVDFAAEFDHMLTWETVRGIRVERNTLKVYTSMIRQRDFQDPSQAWPLGEFIITISPLQKDARESNIIKNISIVPREDVWKSPWLHPEIKLGSEAICFGTGFNQAVWKLFQERKLKDLAHTLLTFLMIDARMPLARSDDEKAKPEKAYTPSPEPFYASDEEQLAAREAYVALARKSFQFVGVDALREQIGQLRKQEFDLIQKFCASRERWRTALFLYNAAEFFANSESAWEEELGIFFGEEALYDISFGEEWMWAHFALASPNDTFDFNVFMWPSKNRVEVTCVPPRPPLITLTGKDEKQMFNFQLHKRVEMKILRLVAAGYLGSALALILRVARGEDQNLIASEATERLYAYRTEMEVNHA